MVQRMEIFHQTMNQFHSIFYAVILSIVYSPEQTVVFCMIFGPRGFKHCKSGILTNFSDLIYINIYAVDDSWDEENWRAQYGQVIKSEDPILDLPVVNLWDWEIVPGVKKDGKGQVTRLVGRLVRQSTKLHPSMPSGGGLLKSAPICEVHLDLVRVTSGLDYFLFHLTILHSM